MHTRTYVMTLVVVCIGVCLAALVPLDSSVLSDSAITHAAFVHDWDSACTDADLDAGPPTDSGWVWRCNYWWWWLYDDCDDCTEGAGSPENHYANVLLDTTGVGCTASCLTFANRYEIIAEVQLCPGIPTPVATATPTTGTVVGQVTLSNGASEETHDLILDGSTGLARSVWDWGDLLTWVPTQVRFEWGDVCPECSSLMKGAAASDFEVSVRCLTWEDR